MMDSLLDPSLLEGLSPEERHEALAAAAAAKRAEEGAEQRALERAMAKRTAERQAQAVVVKADPALTSSVSGAIGGGGAASSINPQIKFVSKRQRLNQPLESEVGSSMKVLDARPPATTSIQPVSKPAIAPPSNGTTTSKYLSDKERHTIRQTYLGKEVQPDERAKPKRRKNEASKKTTFRFQWDDTDDTLDQADPLYSSSAAVAATQKSHRGDPLERTNTNNNNTNKRITASVHTKPLDQMTSRDWRIYRENYEIVVKGGRAPPPLRNFREAGLNPDLLHSIETVLRYTEPTPIQRQAIPIGLERRDLIGIAETGSGKVSIEIICNFGGKCIDIDLSNGFVVSLDCRLWSAAAAVHLSAVKGYYGPSCR
jgi:ATP-dependent RNA helicase DDX23/PRP28